MDTTPSAAPRVPGYELVERLGTGASSVVWRALRSVDGAPVAVKVVSVWGEADGAARELGLLQRLRVEGLVRVREAFSLPDDPAAVVLVLDLLEGGSLTSVLAARGHLSAGESVTVLAAVARALADLHGVGVVHADVSPGNVLFERSGRPMLADLGVSRLTGEVPCEAFGTAGFTAPEVEAGEQPTPASDVYAVGALAWACVTGGPPGPMGARRPLAELAPGLPVAWSEVVRDCLAPLAADRPSAAEAALRFFDAVPCEPLRLVAGTDEASLLTRRIRSTAVPEEELPAAPGWRERAGARLSAVGRARRARRGGAGRSRPGTARRRAVVVGLGLCVAAVTVTAATRATGWLPAVVGARPAAPAPVTGSPMQSVGLSVREDPEGPRRQPQRLMQALADSRAAVLGDGTSSRLDEVDLPGSPAWDADQRLLGQLRARGERYAGVAFVVRTARHLSGDHQGAQLRVRVDTAAYQVIGPGRSELRRPAEAGRELVVHLRWSANRWLVQEVSAAA